ncbi:MAG: hypothetical protein QW584_01495 [Thermofilaceae archaeon]
MHGFRGFSLPKLREKGPELYSYVESIARWGHTVELLEPGARLNTNGNPLPEGWGAYV